MTQTERDRLQGLGIAADKLAITPFGIDLQTSVGGDPNFLRQRYNVDGPVVLHLGMKAFDKGSQTLVEAMKLAWSRGSSAWLVMAGPSLSTFDDFIRTTGTNCPRLLNLPPFDEAQKRDLLASATIVAQPSRVESLGLVLIEAWANSKPVITADIAVSRELIASCGGGVTVPFGQPEQLAGAIENLLSDAALRQRMGAGGYEMSSQYDGDTAWRRTTAELERVARSPRFSAEPEHAG